ncbi:MAG: hypothetical protein H7255_21285 [Ramlibacter sp.]|nr:hypothetical protein [Ramlibacter sp.]
MERTVLCRPQGGLNDMLSRIEVCCRYAEVSMRRVVVDTNYAGTQSFHDDLRNYFDSRQSRLLLGLDETSETLDSISVAPSFLQGRVSSYVAQRREPKAHGEQRPPDEMGWCDTITGKSIKFDLNKLHEEQLLVHHADGRNELALFALMRMVVKREVSDELKRRLMAIGAGYHAIHVRHTDYRSNYRPLIEAMRQSPPHKLFVATDNVQVLEEFRAALGAKRVFSFSALPASAGEPLHRNPPASSDQFARNRDAIVDLLMLGLARQLTLVKLEEGSRYEYSGYSELARRLWSTKIVLKHLIGRDDIRTGLD